jgi:steroid 5-alpha reductase family enzyme
MTNDRAPHPSPPRGPGLTIGYPDMRSQPVLGLRNLANLALLIAVPIPGILFTGWLYSYFEAGAIPADPGWAGAVGPETWAAYLLHHPIITVNLIFFVNICLLFWLLALAQKSSWLIDPYWTLIPPLINWFYWAHPLADGSTSRSTLTWVLLLVWSSRLTHNYLRREKWRFGYREDWRFAKRRNETRNFWWFQFIYVYAAQQVLLVGLTLPFFAIHFRNSPLGPADFVLALLAVIGIGIAHLADASLDRFMQSNAKKIARGEPKEPLLDTGIWRWSRHPNYFGEQLFWWAIAGFGWVLGEPWVIVGAAANSLVLAAVTVMTERRMVADEARSEAFRAYRKRTSVWLPWPPARNQTVRRNT